MKVSSATVSYVLNGKAEEKRISKVLEIKIRDYAHELGYRPNMIAKSLRTGKTKTIGMLVEDIADPFFSNTARVVEEIATQLGYKLFYSSTKNDTSIAKGLLRVFRDAQVDGYIIAPPPGIEQDIRELMEEGYPVILFDRYFSTLDTTNVVADNYGGAYKAMLHFLQNGYRSIGLVTIDSEQVQMKDRLHGYYNGIEEHHLEPAVLKVPFELKHKMLAERISSFLDRNPQLDAVLFATNYLAISGLEVLGKKGMQVPHDLAVIGFDDNNHFSLFSPSITAVAQPVEIISETMIRQLIDCLEKGSTLEKKTTTLPVKLVARESSLPVLVSR